MKLFDILIWTPVAVVVTILLCGTPYFQAGPTFITGRLPGVRCSYVGWQGFRSLSFDDARNCPLIVFMPMFVLPEPRPPAPSRAAEENRPLREKPMPYGPGGPEVPPRQDDNPTRQAIIMYKQITYPDTSL